MKEEREVERMSPSENSSRYSESVAPVLKVNHRWPGNKTQKRGLGGGMAKLFPERLTQVRMFKRYLKRIGTWN